MRFPKDKLEGIERSSDFAVRVVYYEILWEAVGIHQFGENNSVVDKQDQVFKLGKRTNTQCA